MTLTAADQAQLNDAINALARDRGRADLLAADLVARYPDEARVHFVYAATRSRLQDYNGAVRHLDIAACEGDSSLVQFNLGYCLRQTGDYLRAAAHLRRAATMPGADESARALAANTFAIVGRETEAQRMLSAAGVTPITMFCRWLLGADDGEVRNYFNEDPARGDAAVLFWMTHDCHAFGALDDKTSLARLLNDALPAYWPHAIELPGPVPKQEDDAWWLFKPAALAGGQGMYLTRSPATLRTVERGIAQRYVHPPLLLNGHKFNLRLLYCVHSVDPLRVFLWRDGLVFVSAEPYTAPSEGEASNAHVVNLLRAKPEDIGRPLGALNGHVVPLQALLASGMVKAAALQDGIARLAANLTTALTTSGFFASVRDAGVAQAFPPRFVGLDVSFTADLEPRLFEIERYPGLGGVSAQSAEINARFRRQWLAFTLRNAPHGDVNFAAVTP
jgi:tetratricopeptide (TPR) repeat protein